MLRNLRGDPRYVEDLEPGRSTGAPDAKRGFFLIPLDAARTSTRRIYIARDACSEIKDG